MMRPYALPWLALPLAACGGTAADQPAVNQTAPDDYVARVRALPTGQRNGVLLRAIRDAGQSCQQVTESVAIPDVGDAPAWQARCDDDGSWVVAFNPGGIATVTSAGAVAGAQRR